MAILIAKKMEKNRLLAYSAIIIIMIGGIVFFIFKMRSSAPADVKQEPGAAQNKLIETESAAPEQNSGMVNEGVGKEKTEESINLNIFIDPKFKALRDNSLD